MDKKTEDILNRDSISETEKFLGKGWPEFNSREELISLAHGAALNQIKAQHLQSINDTYFSMSWSYFKTLLTNKGFKKGFERDFIDGNKIEEEIIYYKPDEGLIVWAESYSQKTMVNVGHLYGEIKARTKEDSYEIFKWLSTGGMIDKENLIFSTSHDIREGLFSKLDVLRSAGDFLPKWIEKKPWLWFVNYMERENESENYKEINARKLKLCPEELLKILS